MEDNVRQTSTWSLGCDVMVDMSVDATKGRGMYRELNLSSSGVNSGSKMTDHEESFLKDFFTHVANLGFDKAKELVVSVKHNFLYIIYFPF